MPEAVYLLCAVASVLCAVLLARGWRASRTRLLFWSSLCFAGLALNNLLLFVDLVLLAGGPDLSTGRNLAALVALGLLMVGLASEQR